LWPDGEPEKTAVTLRTLNSHLRSAFDPFMRQRGPNRYIVAERDVYRFDPYGVVTSDAQQFSQRVAAALRRGDLDDVALRALDRCCKGTPRCCPICLTPIGCWSRASG
jgi:DNA-binding SARP family transcriptional activator